MTNGVNNLIFSFPSLPLPHLPQLCGHREHRSFWHVEGVELIISSLECSKYKQLCDVPGQEGEVLSCYAERMLVWMRNAGEMKVQISTRYVRTNNQAIG